MEYPQAIVSIVILCICVLVGLPLWWNTTKVYRADLPHEKISTLHSSSSKLKIKLEIILSKDLNKETLKDNLLMKLSLNPQLLQFMFDVDLANRDLNLQNNMVEYCNVNTVDNTGGDSLKYNFFILEDSSVRIVTNYYCNSNLKTIILLPTGFEGDINDVLTRLISVYISPSKLTTNSSVDLPKKTFNRETLMKSVPPSEAYRLTFTLAVANPSDYLPTWNIEGAIQTYLNPLLKRLEFMGPFHVSSQILYYADVSIKPIKDNDKFYYSKAKLPLFINPLESRLNTYTTTDVSLNFILYIPPKRFLPLVIKNKKSDEVWFTAFHSPRWGGIQFYSPNKTNKEIHISVPMEEPMGTFIEQFKVLIGLDSQEINKHFTQNDQVSIADWLITKLLISKTFEHLNKCISTLSSLSELLDKIANIVIGDDIKVLIETAVKNTEQSKQCLEDGLLDKAYNYSKKAFIASEKAFYDSTLLSLLYFPDDQKYAIYVPLFLPIALPILISFGKAIKWLKQKDSLEKVKPD